MTTPGIVNRLNDAGDRRSASDRGASAKSTNLATTPGVGEEDDAIERLNEAVARLNECLREAREIRARLLAAASSASQPWPDPAQISRSLPEKPPELLAKPPDDDLSS
jgi:hypothetical protein